MMHLCVCGRYSETHDERCYEPDCDLYHWPPLCCRECPCCSYQDAHRVLHVLQAMADDQIGFVMHGTQLHLQWWITPYKKRRLTKDERAVTLEALGNDWAYKAYAIGRGPSRGMLALTRDGRRRLHGVPEHLQPAE